MTTPKLRQWWIPGGDMGARDTLTAMVNVARAGARQPLTRATAQGIVQYATGDGLAQMRLLRAWLAEHFAFVDDPRWLELLRTPEVMLQQIASQYVAYGDCDDAAILAAALATSVGVPVMFAAIAFSSPTAPYSHVIAYAKTPVGWLDFDVTKPAQFLPPMATRQLLTMVV